MSVLKNRIEQLSNLRASLVTKSIESKIPVLNYLQLLDYHIRLLEETDALVTAITESNQEFVQRWYKNRIENNELHPTNSEVTQ